MSDPLAPPDLHALRGLAPAEVATALRPLGVEAAVERLAASALEEADRDPEQAQRWIESADQFAPLPDASAAGLDYARARLAAMLGELPAAEEALRRAQARWEAAGESRRRARSFLGLTQILAMQGRYAEAEDAAQTAVQGFTPADGAEADPADSVDLAKALINLATLYHYQERHADALPPLDRAQALIEALLATPADDPDLAADLAADLAHAELARANALTFLDRPDEAQAAFTNAVARFDALGDPVNRGRARTNLGRLLLRRGDYADALRAFETATRDILGVGSPAEAPADADLRLADELLLEQATAYLALNLLPEAEEALRRAEALFRPADQPYELAHTLYLRGLAQLRAGEAAADIAAAGPLLAEALALFESLDNLYWVRRTQTALAVLAQRTGDAAAAAAMLDVLLAAPAPDSAQESAPLWETLARAEALILRGHLDADSGDATAARTRAAEAAALLGEELEVETPTLPHLALRIRHLLGRAARLAGERDEARRHLRAAVEIVEAQRAALPLEEIRTAFLDDKSALYAELLLALLDAPQPSAAEVDAAFDAVERARSRALLERLLAAMPGPTESAPDSAPDSALDEMRRRLHWLYNTLLGESGSRGLTPVLSDLLRAQEAAVQRLEGERAPRLGAARPVDPAAFRATLDNDRQAIVYAVAGEELMAFVVERAGAQVVRRLCTTPELAAAGVELRFQLGRAALGGDYLARHPTRLTARLRAALHNLYRLAVEPLLPLLTRPRLLVLPAGALHGVPIHALWDGERYLLERFEIAVAPSASVAVRAREGVNGGEFALAAGSWAGLAIADAAIPAARAEVKTAARRFAEARLYVDHAASLAGLRAAAQADILHVATHGLFRSDNPFFSVLKLADGWIDVRELYRLPLAARLVVLSACESGAGTIRPGDEVIGLARGFLAAGARTIIATLWHVHDAGAAQLMEAFYAALTAPGVPVRPAAALRTAQQRAIAAAQPPWYWAPFYVIGE